MRAALRAPADRDARVGRPRAVRLLDARRLPELGHGPGLRPLASGQEARPLPAGAARGRASPALPARRRPTAGGRSTCSTGGSCCSTAGWTRAAGLPPPSSSTSAPPSARAATSTCTPRGCRPTPRRRSRWGSARMRGSEPPPLYAYDPDIGRLAVTTPAYNTAMLAVNSGAVPYGGTSSRGSSTASSAWRRTSAGAAGVVRRARHRPRDAARAPSSQRGRAAAATSRIRRCASRARRAASGRTCAAYPRHAYAGRFEHLDARAGPRSSTAAIRTRHRFRRHWIETRVDVLPRGGRRRQTVRVLFPSWGKKADDHGGACATAGACRVNDRLSLAGLRYGSSCGARDRLRDGAARADARRRCGCCIPRRNRRAPARADAGV